MRSSHIAEKLEINFEIDINATPEVVWAQLVSIEGMNQWFSKNLVFESFIGGEFRMEVNIPEEGEFTFFGEILKIDPPNELAFTWTEHEKGKEPWPVSTLVRFKLKPSASGTHVTLTHSGFDALDKAIAREEYEGHIVGWERSATLDGLKRVVEAAHEQAA